MHSCVRFPPLPLPLLHQLRDAGMHTCVCMSMRMCMVYVFVRMFAQRTVASRALALTYTSCVIWLCNHTRCIL